MSLKSKVFWSLQGLLCALIFITILVFFKVLSNVSEFKVPKQELPYELKAGSYVKTVVHDLAKSEYPNFILDLWLLVHGRDFQNIQRGKYTVDGEKSLYTILEDMKNGNVSKEVESTILFREGINFYAMDKILKQHKFLSQKEELFFNPKNTRAFLEKYVKEEQLPYIGGPHDNIEGLLMPDTYKFYESDGEIDVIKLALKAMVSFMQENWDKRAENLFIKDPYEALILASLVERESSIDSEKATIAGVFYNRLNKNMRLQTDPAVMYGIAPDFKGPLTRAQLKEDSPYNTYTREGLPPTPICMPSRSSILAVLHPEDTKALYFVAKDEDPKNGHVFSNTLKEHNRAVASYKRKVREYKRQQKSN